MAPKRRRDEAEKAEEEKGGGAMTRQRPSAQAPRNTPVRGCVAAWLNRDVSAANVIRVLLLLKLMGFERPTKLQRPPWPPAAAGPAESLNGASRAWG
ncbi:hypothetical protein CHLRE_04g226350v5 [Chlamydomonas reinhardtii]|uniref:Uncharacterized protein n=1 Tax=Chlamydomonas reinhardtii TaxID=3055 RepID=A0A2K3DUM8_CHLRE|nr:uncharacterized protein CHLRE_04g226350v5 [Chlamydomonas reinhardtii]PNW84241.1 hypothetical protein CHLRE_04g226350v5 [Chlamydomonas reinhardtii]